MLANFVAVTKYYVSVDLIWNSTQHDSSLFVLSMNHQCNPPINFCVHSLAETHHMVQKLT